MQHTGAIKGARGRLMCPSFHGHVSFYGHVSYRGHGSYQTKGHGGRYSRISNGRLTVSGVFPAVTKAVTKAVTSACIAASRGTHLCEHDDVVEGPALLRPRHLLPHTHTPHDLCFDRATSRQLRGAGRACRSFRSVPAGDPDPSELPG